MSAKEKQFAGENRISRVEVRDEKAVKLMCVWIWKMQDDESTTPRKGSAQKTKSELFCVHLRSFAKINYPIRADVSVGVCVVDLASDSGQESGDDDVEIVHEKIVTVYVV